MVDPTIIQEWVLKAEVDFHFARISLSENKPFWAHICFLFQQSAEKYLKAFIIANHLKFQRTHDFQVLLKQCLEKTPSLKNRFLPKPTTYLQPEMAMQPAPF